MSEDVKCKDCIHSFRTISSFLLHGRGEYAYYCRESYKPAMIEHNPVIGPIKKKGYYESCSIARIGRADRDDRCGETAKWWQPKNKKDLFKFIKHVSA